MGRLAGVVDLVETCIAEWPLRERFRAQQMEALYHSGRQPEALRAYQRFRSELGSELGLEPSPTLNQLEDRILRQDPDLVSSPTRTAALAPPTTSSQPWARGNLPLPVNTFVGRDVELAVLAERLETVRLLTLTGPGGVGKTRLAMRLAAVTADLYPDGVWVCDLAAVREPALAAHAITPPSMSNAGRTAPPSRASRGAQATAPAGGVRQLRTPAERHRSHCRGRVLPDLTDR